MHRAGAAMPVAALDCRRVGLDKTEGSNRQAQEIGGDLCEAGLVALAVRLGTEEERDTAVRLEADLGAFAWRAARRFEKTANTEPAQPPALRRGLAPRGKAARSDPLRYLVEIGGEASAIDCHPETAAIRKTADQVAPAQLDRVERQPARRAVSEPFDQVIGFGLAGAAIGIDRQRVREDAAHRHGMS